MLGKDNVIRASVSEAVEKTPANEKYYYKCTCMRFTLYSHSIERATFAATHSQTNI